MTVRGYGPNGYAIPVGAKDSVHIAGTLLLVVGVVLGVGAVNWIRGIGSLFKARKQ